MAIENAVKDIAAALEKESNTKAVFGEPMKLDNKVVIPVAAVRIGAGGAAVAPPANASDFMKAVFGGGGGGAYDLRPIGFISEHNGEVVFTPIHIDVRGKPFLNEASHGLGRVIETVSEILSHRLIPTNHKN
jgi:uncharacterized spore protein YtfJ